MIDIRPAARADVPALVECHLACWLEAYRELAPAGYLRQLEQGRPARIAYWTTKIENGAPPWLAVDDGAVVGVAAAGPTEDEELRPGLELFLIYVRQAYWSTGLGWRLLTATIGDRPAFLWVLRDNPRAVGFYRRQGFAPDGAEKLHQGLGRTVIRLTRPGGPPNR